MHESKSRSGLQKGRSEHQKLGVVLGGNDWKHVLLCLFVVWARNDTTLCATLRNPIKYATLCIQVGVPLLLLTMHSPEFPSFFELTRFGCGVSGFGNLSPKGANSEYFRILNNYDF